MNSLLSVIFLVCVSAAPWYAQRDLGDFHLQSVIERDCYHGTYGSLSLFTCPLTHVFIQPFAEVSSGTQMCVIESRDQSHETVSLMAAHSQEVKILYNDLEKYIVVGSLLPPQDAYPEICSRSYFKGEALNVMTVAQNAFRPSTLNILEGHEDIKLDAISDFIAQVRAADLQTLVTQLAQGPGGADGTWNSRNSFATGSRQAQNWTERLFRSYGANDVQQNTFNTQYCNNVIAEYTGTTRPLEIVVVGAHMDSRNEGVNNTSNPAPGADDNGSGSASAILFSRLINQTGVFRNFARTLRIQTYCGEEQGLVGSGAIARDYRSRNVNVVAMYNIDMVGYRRPAPNNYISIAFMTGSTNVNLTNSCKNVARQYNEYGPTTNTYIGDTSACCSDQQSFHQQSYAAVSVFETNTSGAVYPDYHRTTDTPDKVNYDQVAAFCRAIYSCALQSVLL